MSGASRLVALVRAAGALSCLLLAARCPTALALNPERSLFELHHTAWTAENGAPSGIAALAQTTDGYLWIGTTTGLFRFDGVRFEPFETVTSERLPSTNVYSLWASPSGGLWIGYRFGGASFFRNGHLTSYSEREGMPAGSTNSFAEDRRGVVWAATSRGLVHLSGSRWQALDVDRANPTIYVRRLFVDQAGALWATTSSMVAVMPLGASEFQPARTRAYFGSIAQSPDGAMWFADGELGVGPLPAEDSTKAVTDGRDQPWVIEAEAGGVLFDRDGNVWANTSTGLYRVRRSADAPAGSPAPEIFDSKSGLTADQVSSLLEDREGNVWVGTTGGLDQFREAPLVRIATPAQARYLSLAAGAEGAMWIGSNSPGLMLARDGIVQRVEGPRQILCAYRDFDGDIWLGGMKALWRFNGSGWDRVNLPSIFSASVPDVQAITKDRAGALWVSLAQNGVYRLADGVWSAYGGLEALPKLTAVAAATDAQGRLWFGYPQNRVSVVDGATVRNFTAQDGLVIGNALSIDAHGKSVWLGGELGLARYDGKRFQAIATLGGTVLGSISGIVETRDGDLWLNSQAGVVRIDAEELQKNTNDPRYPVRVESFGFLDGLPGSLQGIRPLPTAAAGSDGRLWFATNNGVAWIDPRRIPRNPVPPPVWVQSIDADGTAIRASPASVRLPANTRNLQITYTALSLSIPERVRFRYQLEGSDTGWQDAGSRRVAFYTNLGPGDYQFRVIASNNDGVWNETGDNLRFTIAPKFFQTAWFRAVCSIAVAALLWSLYMLRLRQLASDIRARLEERVIERERIARDLHDTLLQSMQGLIFRFQAASERLPADEPVRAVMSEELDRADQVLADGRDRLSGLRTAPTDTPELSEALSQLCSHLAQGQPTECQSTVQGRPRALHPLVREETYHIGAEALRNAFLHAKAKRIELEVIYDRAELSVRVRDDGIGVDASTLVSGGRPGRWGMVGMRERATRIRGRLNLWSKLEAGTEVILRVPSAVAYTALVRAERRSWLRRTLKAREIVD